MDAGNALHRAHAHPLSEKFKNPDGLVHGRVHAVKMILARLRENLAALGALVALTVLAQRDIVKRCGRFRAV